jgi:hypothetical protein
MEENLPVTQVEVVEEAGQVVSVRTISVGQGEAAQEWLAL